MSDYLFDYSVPETLEKMGSKKAGYGSRTRLLGLGSRCTTDVLILHSNNSITPEHGIFQPHKSKKSIKYYLNYKTNKFVCFLTVLFGQISLYYSI